MIHVEFDVHRVRDIHSHKNYELIFVMDGCCTVTLNGMLVRLEKGEFVIVNSGQMHGYSLTGDTDLIGRFHIPFSHIGDENEDKQVVFLLDRNRERNVKAMEKAKAILQKIFVMGSQNGSGADMEIQSLYFGLLEIFFENFAYVEKEKAEPVMDREADRRICEIMEYVNHNYDKNIGLNDLASRLFLSSTYLSKYIKQQLGVNFVELLNKTRLSHAADALAHTDENIAQIAMNVGFSNMASFNRSFKEKYGTTPTGYRRDVRKKDSDMNNKSLDGFTSHEVSPDHSAESAETASVQKNSGTRHGESVVYEEIFVENARSVTVLPFQKPWSMTINIGAAEELLHSDVQAHIIELKKGLHFRYVRFWDIFSTGMYLSEHNDGQIYNFTRLDRVLDFLVENQLMPHMEISNKPKKLMRAMRDDMVKPKKGDSPFKSPDMIRYFFSALMRHLIRRYGAEMLDKWVFEYWMEEDDEIIYDGWNCYNTKMISQYLDNFTVLARTIRRFGTRLKLGGGGFSLRYGKKWFQHIIRSWAHREEKPAFVSLYIYPYELNDADICLNNHVLRTDYMRSCLKFASEIMEQEKLSVRLVVTEWNITVFNRNLINDSVYKGAWMMKNLFDCMGLSSVLAYWTGSDLYAECYDQTAFISGNVGLLTRDAIRKPVWYALEFLNNLERFICKKTENVIVTRGKYKNFKIVCHNFKPLNHKYYLKSEDAISMDDLSSFFDDQRFLRIYFELPVLPEDTYRIKFLRVNQNSGSVLDQWAAMSSPQYMDSEDVEYLKKRVCLRLRYVPIGRKTVRLPLQQCWNPMKYS